MPSLTQIPPGMNAYSYAFDAAILAGLQSLYRARLAPLFDTPEYAPLLAGGENRVGEFGGEAPTFFYATYGTEPLLWVSNNDWESYRLFKAVFEEIAIAPEIENLVDHRDGITLYSGFFVVGHHADNTNWHLDYAEGANAYTLITPLFALNPGHGNLLFRDDGGAVHTYRYRLGEAIVLGDRFPHTTEPYAGTGEMRVLLSMTFGTDKLEHWDALKQTVGGQSKFLILPCGHRLGECRCLEG